ncbi:MAG: tetratricopeptide (TPR) repeat protein [Flavobacterium sp.]
MNTLDVPVLEHLMSRIPTDDMASFRSLILNPRSYSSLSSNMGEAYDWNLREFAYFAEHRLTSRGLRKLILGLVYRHTEKADMEYIDAIKTHARLVNSLSDYRHSFEELLLLVECIESESFYQEALDQLPTDGLYDIAKCYYYLDDYDNARRVFMSLWLVEENFKIPLYLARAYIKQYAFNSALPWLMKAREFHLADRERIDYYTAVVYEGLGDKNLAIKFYRSSMQKNASDHYITARNRLRVLELG